MDTAGLGCDMLSQSPDVKGVRFIGGGSYFGLIVTRVDSGFTEEGELNLFHLIRPILLETA